MIYRYLTALSTYRNNLMGKSPDWASNNVSLFYEKKNSGLQNHTGEGIMQCVSDL